MIPISQLELFALAALLMVLTPGPNMIYLISRSICQGRKAGIVSLIGVVAGFIVHMLAAGLGVTTLFLHVPVAYEILRWAGVAYLLWLAWQAVRPGARSPFETKELPSQSPSRLFMMGFLTNLLNPKIAIFYLAIFPQFISATQGSVLLQSIFLGSIQILISLSVNFSIVLAAGAIASWFMSNQLWLRVQRYLMGSVLGGLALHLAVDGRRNA